VSLPIVWFNASKAEFYAAEQWQADVSHDLADRFTQAVDDSLRPSRNIRSISLWCTEASAEHLCVASRIALLTSW
jgi:hypothetical protein